MNGSRGRGWRRLRLRPPRPPASENRVVGASGQLSSGQPSPAAGGLHLMALEVPHSSCSGDAGGPALPGRGPGWAWNLGSLGPGKASAGDWRSLVLGEVLPGQLAALGYGHPGTVTSQLDPIAIWQVSGARMKKSNWGAHRCHCPPCLPHLLPSQAQSTCHAQAVGRTQDPSPFAP